MTALDATKDILTRLSVRDAMRDPRYFVGREQELGLASGTYYGDQRSFVWIHGPRRIGKSSLGWQLMTKAGEAGAITSRVDALTLGGQASFRDVLDRAIANLGDGPRASEGTPWQRFERIVRRGRRPLLFVFDEFDRIGCRLTEEEQGSLRALKQDCPSLACVFISRADPARLVEEYPAEMSRLTGVCTPIRLRPFKRSAVVDLAGVVRADLGLPNDDLEWATEVWKRVGGYPVLVMGLLHQLAIGVTHGGAGTDFVELLEDARAALLADLSSFWWDLPARTRMAIAGRVTQTANDWRAAGLWDRDEPIVPAFLADVGSQLGVTRHRAGQDSTGEPVIGRIELLHELIAQVNDSVKLFGAAQPFVLTTELLRYSSAVRGGDSRDGAHRFVDYMHKLVYEGARERAGDKRWRFPAELESLYKASPVIGDISNLRNFFRHDQNRPSDAGTGNEAFVEAAAIFRRLCGTENPRSAEHWRRLRDSILEGACALLDELQVTLDRRAPTP